jgi:hypothetical protein
METPLYPQKYTKWCVACNSSAGTVGPVLLDNTVNVERYLELLQDHSVPTFQGMGVGQGRAT